MSCTVCQHQKRHAIDAAMSRDDYDELTVAAQFGVTRHALRQHDEHRHAKPQDTEQRHVSVGGKPARSRSVSRETTAEEECVELLRHVKDLVADVSNNEESTPADRTRAILAAAKVVDQLAKIRGEKPLGEDVICRSPAWLRIQKAIADALAPYPDAADAVAAALESVFVSSAAKAA